MSRSKDDQTIDKNPPLVVILTTLLMAVISAAWFFVMVKFWPYHPAIGWSLFAIPVGITVIIPLMYMVRRIQARK